MPGALLSRAPVFTKLKMLLPPVPYRRAKVLVLAAVLLAAAVLSLMRGARSASPPAERLPWRETRPGHDLNGTSAHAPVNVAGHLRRLVHEHSLTGQVAWHARRVRPRFSAARRLSMTETASRFAPPELRRAGAEDEAHWLEPPAEALVLPVGPSARPGEVDASALLFGMSTSHARLVYAGHAMLDDWARWLTDGRGSSNGARLVLTVHGAGSSDIAEVGRRLRAAGVDAEVVRSEGGLDSTARYAGLLAALDRRAAVAGAGAEYLALVDDDVFFPDLDRLIRRLHALDPGKPYYIGAPSERSDWVTDRNASTTYGGGAVFLTRPMARRLTRLPCFALSEATDPSPPSSSTTDRGQWDEHIYRCVTQHTDAPLHVLPSLYAPRDGPLYGGGHDGGGYGGGVRPLALHHYRNWHRLEAGRAHRVADACGCGCFLQRFLFPDGWVLTNGYTIAQYPDGVEAVPLRGRGAGAGGGQQQPPGAESSGRLVIEDDPGRMAGAKVVAWRGRRRTWRLVDSWAGEAGGVWQAYVKRRGGGNSVGAGEDRVPGDEVHAEEEKADVDSVILLLWEA